MSDLNKVMLIGRLGGDPEMRYTGSGSAIANFNLATSERWTDKNTGEKKERTEWHKVTFFGRLAEVIGEYASKGKQVYIEGNLQTEKWQDNNGQDRYTTKVIGREFKLLGSRGDQPTQPAQTGGFREKPAEAQNGQGQDDNIPF